MTKEEIGTPEELNLRAGDKVEYVSGACDGRSYKGLTWVFCDSHPDGCCTSPCVVIEGTSKFVTENVNWKFKVISRASEQPKVWKDMTPEEKGALLLAHHEGKTIQRIDSNNLCVWDCVEPNWIDQFAYRVKPEPVRETVVISNFHEKARCYSVKFDTVDGEIDRDSLRWGDE